MFKVGDKVRVKRNLKDILNEMGAAGKYRIETYRMANVFSGKIGVVQEIRDLNTYKVFDYYWKEYSLEYPASDSISGYDLLL